jgi:hypothetical protein
MFNPQPQLVHRQTVEVTAATCHNLSLFKGMKCTFLVTQRWPTFAEILKEYRKLDDTIVMRLNRANARMRDHNRHQTTNGEQTLQDQACHNVWRELVGKLYFYRYEPRTIICAANWTRRRQLIGFCGDVMDQLLAEKETTVDGDQTPSFKTKVRLYN